MRKLLLSVVCLFAGATTFAQKLEVTAGVSSGFLKYSGASSVSSSFMLISSSPNLKSAYTNSPYGSKFGFGYGLSGQAQLVGKGGFMIGLQAAYEQLKSKVSITEVYLYDPVSSSQNGQHLAANGSTALQNDIVNLNPYIGYRLPLPAVKLDILAGADVAFITAAQEKGSAKASDGVTYKTDLDRKTISKDFRLRFGLAATIHKLSLNASYAHGLRNSMEGYIGGSPEAYSRVVRVGLGYRLF